MPLEEVPPKTPIIDFIESIPKIGPVLAPVLRAGRPRWMRRREKRVQDQIDRDWHDALRQGKPDREDNP